MERQGEVDVARLRRVELGEVMGNGIAVLKGVKPASAWSSAAQRCSSMASRSASFPDRSPTQTDLLRMCMSEQHNDQQLIERTHNTARFFTETRHVAWVLLIGTIVWGVYGYVQMPQRKDPDIPIRQALALCPWPGASAEKIEQLVTRRIEEKIAENVKVEKIESNTRTGVTAVYHHARRRASATPARSSTTSS